MVLQGNIKFATNSRQIGRVKIKNLPRKFHCAPKNQTSGIKILCLSQQARRTLLSKIALCATAKSIPSKKGFIDFQCCPKVGSSSTSSHVIPWI